jgi:hypothetical protein
MDATLPGGGGQALRDGFRVALVIVRARRTGANRLGMVTI